VRIALADPIVIMISSVFGYEIEEEDVMEDCHENKISTTSELSMFAG